MIFQFRVNHLPFKIKNENYFFSNRRFTGFFDKTDADEKDKVGLNPIQIRAMEWSMV